MSQLSGSPVSKPRRNHDTRCSDEPWVHDSGLTWPCGLLLDAVVADRSRGVQRLADLAGLELIALLGVVGPRAGEAVRLQLEGDRVLVGPTRVLLPRPVDLGR